MTAEGAAATRCPLCGHDRALPLTDRPFGIRCAFERDGRVFGNFLCARCGLGYLHPRPHPDLLDEIYAGEYRPSDELFAGIDLPNVQRQRRRFFLLDEFVRQAGGGRPPIFGEGARVLDVGCYSGEILHALRRKYGCEVVGLELDPDVVPYARAVNSIDVRVVDDLSEMGAALDGEAFDVVVMVHSLEHILPLREFLRLLGERVVRPGGHLVAEVPDLLSSPCYDVTHLNHFCAPSARYALAMHRFSTVAADVRTGSGRNTSSGGSLYVLARREESVPLPEVDAGAIHRRRRWYACTARLRQAAEIARRIRRRITS